MGRAYLGAGEIRRFTAAANVVNAYQNRARSNNWQTWEKENPESAGLLAIAVQGLDDISS